MIELTENQMKMFELLKGGRIVSLDEIMKATRRKKWDRSGTIVNLKYLSAAVAPHGYIITRESGLGRGAKAQYRMTRKFKP